MRLLWLALGFLPYAALAGYDGWLHEKARVVPRIEQALHAALALSMLLFVVLVIRGEVVAGMVAIAGFAVVLLIDELGFHAMLDRRERRIHWFADAALLGFVVWWLYIDGIIGA